MISLYRKPLPLGLWLISAVSLALAAHLILSGLSTSAIFFSVAGSILFLISRHKILWTVAAAWIWVSILFFISYFSASFTDLSQFEKITLVLYFGILLLQIASFVYYFKYPYVNSRTSFLGSGDRTDKIRQGFVQFESRNLAVEIVDLSVSGASFLLPDEGSVHSKTSIILEIPALDQFKMKGRVVRTNKNLIAIQFTGWSPQSVKEHFKLIRGIKKTSREESVLTNSKGFTAFEAVITCGLSSIAIYAASTVFVNLSQVGFKNDLLVQVQSTRDELVKIMRDPRAWQTGLEILRFNQDSFTV